MYHDGEGLRYQFRVGPGNLWRVTRNGVVIAEGNDHDSLLAFAAILNCGGTLDLARELLSGPVPVEAGR